MILLQVLINNHLVNYNQDITATTEKHSCGKTTQNIPTINNCQLSNLESTNLHDIFSADPNLGLGHVVNNVLPNCRGTVFIPFRIKNILPDSSRIQNNLDKVQRVQNSDGKFQQTPGKVLILERSNHMH